MNIAPPGGSLGAWYHGPSEDLVRPGSIWYAPGERESLPLWQEVSTAYHEGFPGHHLQVGTAVVKRDQMSRFHRLVIWNSGSGEGWALYAERLMDELGFYEKPEYRLGWLVSQLFRTVRVVLDIGCQLKLELPDDAPMYSGEVWNYDIGVDYMNLVAHQPRDVSESEVTRYLGWYGQAISYKVGEREILDIREAAKQSSDYVEKDFHRKMLEAGAIRLRSAPRRDAVTKTYFDLDEAAARDSYKLLSGLIVPRPIGWIGTRRSNGTYNLAPFSFFNVVSADPPVVLFSAGSHADRPKDSATLAAESGEFSVNIVSESVAEAMSATSASFGPEDDEFAIVGLTPIPGKKVSAPLVAESPGQPRMPGKPGNPPRGAGAHPSGAW